MEDFVVAKHYGIGTLNYILDNGLFADDVALFAGQHVYKVDDSVLEVLREHKRLTELRPICSQLRPLLAHQDPIDLSRHTAVVYLDG